jgi:hypothetical protein
MAKTDPVETPTPAEAPAVTDAERAELESLRAENARLADENADLRADLDDRPAMFTTEAPRAAVSDADRRRAVAEHERAVMDRSEGARLDREEQARRASLVDGPAPDDIARRDELDGE